MITQKIKNNYQTIQQYYFHVYTHKNWKQGLKRNICTTTYTIAWFTVAKKKCDTYNGILLNFKRKMILIYAATRMNFEDITLNEIKQSQKDMYDSTYMRYLE